MTHDEVPAGVVAGVVEQDTRTVVGDAVRPTHRLGRAVTQIEARVGHSCRQTYT